MQDRPHDARPYRFKQPAEQNEHESGAEPGECGADGEHEHGADHDLSCGEASGEECGERHHDAHDELEDRGEPLAGGYGDAEVVDDGGQCRAELQLREVADEGDEGEDGNGNEGRVREFAVRV